MNRLAQAFIEFEDHLDVLGLELRSLKKYATFLEDENSRLKRELSVLSAVEPEVLQANSVGIHGLAAENLEKMYADFFHVCHLCFAKPRTEPCLFCEALLRRDE
jgi:regulator of replication initiation timing